MCCNSKLIYNTNYSKAAVSTLERIISAASSKHNSLLRSGGRPGRVQQLELSDSQVRFGDQNGEPLLFVDDVNAAQQPAALRVRLRASSAGGASMAAVGGEWAGGRRGHLRAARRAPKHRKGSEAVDARSGREVSVVDSAALTHTNTNTESDGHAILFERPERGKWMRDRAVFWCAPSHRRCRRITSPSATR